MDNIDFDPTAPLLDIWFTDALDAPLRTIEQPTLGCPCDDLDGRISNSWLYNREPECACPAATNDYEDILHSPECDSVPCPFCPAEASRDDES